jgi:predicted nucleic acid-binding protein
MAHLVDTSVLVRLANTADALYGVAARAVLELHQGGNLLQITAQNLVEFRNVATRPAKHNGLGLSIVEARAKAAMFEAAFPLLPETPDIYPTWKSMVDAVGIIGKQVHDARLVAVCHVHRIANLLTFNVGHFMPLAGFGPGVTIVDPASV